MTHAWTDRHRSLLLISKGGKELSLEEEQKYATYADLMLPLQPLVFVEASYVMASLKARRMNMGTQCSLSIKALTSLEADAIASLYAESICGKVVIALRRLHKQDVFSSIELLNAGTWVVRVHECRNDSKLVKESMKVSDALSRKCLQKMSPQASLRGEKALSTHRSHTMCLGTLRDVVLS